MSDAYTRRARARVMEMLSQPGCIFCRQNRESLENFFFWYLHEGYMEPENVRRMKESKGLCPAHTRELLYRGQPHTIASIYAPLLSSALRELREEERLPDRLSPAGECPACTSISRGEESLLGYLRLNLGDEEVCARLSSKPSICMNHLLDFSALLDWNELATLATVFLKYLEEVSKENLPMLLAGEGEGRRLPSALPDTSARDGSWSRSLKELSGLMQVEHCPVCLSQRLAVSSYFGWLSEEVLDAPEHQWGEARWLCREHLHGFAAIGDKEAVLRLVEAVRDHWRVGLGRLVEGLEQRPPANPFLRLSKIPYSLRKVREEKVSNGPLAALRIAVVEAVRPPGARLRTLRDSVLRRRSCPACVYLRSREERVGDLIWRSILDPDTLRVYSRSHGLCLRHLPAALSRCEENRSAELLAQDERTRMRVLQWELREFQRKQNWNIRYEPKGGEGDAWRRALLAYSGDGE